MSTRFKFRMKKSNFCMELVQKFRKEFVTNVTRFFEVFNSFNKQKKSRT